MNQSREFTLVPPASQQPTQLGFYARTILVDNPTPAYWYLPRQRRFVPPYQSGMVVSTLGTEVGEIQYLAPPGIPQPDNTAYSTGATASFIYFEDDLGADSGVTGAFNADNRYETNIAMPSATTTFVFPTPAPHGFMLIFGSLMQPLLVNYTLRLTRLPQNPRDIAVSQNMRLDGAQPFSPELFYPYPVSALSILTIIMGGYIANSMFATVSY